VLFSGFASGLPRPEPSLVTSTVSAPSGTDNASCVRFYSTNSIYLQCTILDQSWRRLKAQVVMPSLPHRVPQVTAAMYLAAIAPACSGRRPRVQPATLSRPHRVLRAMAPGTSMIRHRPRGQRLRWLLRPQLLRPDRTLHRLMALVLLTGEVQVMMIVLHVSRFSIFLSSDSGLIPMRDRMCSFFRLSGGILRTYCYRR
jgi:hypothetical protein